MTNKQLINQLDFLPCISKLHKNVSSLECQRDEIEEQIDDIYSEITNIKKKIIKIFNFKKEFKSLTFDEFADIYKIIYDCDDIKLTNKFITNSFVYFFEHQVEFAEAVKEIAENLESKLGAKA